MQDNAVLARSSIASLLGGLTFAVGWWILIDGYAYGAYTGSPAAAATQGYGWLPPFGATITFVMMNGMRWSELREDITGDTSAAAKAKLFLILSLFIACGSVVGAAVLMVSYMCTGMRLCMADSLAWLSQSNKFTSAAAGDITPWTGISCLVSTLVIILASWIMRLGTLPPPQ